MIALAAYQKNTILRNTQVRRFMPKKNDKKVIL